MRKSNLKLIAGVTLIETAGHSKQNRRFRFAEDTKLLSIRNCFVQKTQTE